jgi:hypothetical protein
MKLILIFLIILSSVFVDARQSESGDTPLSYTHILPSTSVIPGGDYVIGTSAGFGLFNFLDFTTNLIYDLEGVFNVMGKIGLIQNHDFGFAPFVTYSAQNLSYYDTNGNLQSPYDTALGVGATFSYRFSSDIIGHTGGEVMTRNPPISKGSIPRTALIQGSNINQEFTFGFTRSFAVAPGASYDATYDIWGAGATFYIANFAVGGHYYFNVQQGNFLPILGVNFSSNF